MNIGVKAGINADKLEIFIEYGDAATENLTLIQGAWGKMAVFIMDPRLSLMLFPNSVNMPRATLPLRMPLDAIAKGTDKNLFGAIRHRRKGWPLIQIHQKDTGYAGILS